MVTGVLVLRGVDRGAVVGPAAPVVVAGRQLVQRAEALDLGGVGGDDPPAGRAGVLPAGDPAASEPSEQGCGRHADLAGQGGQSPLAGPEAAVIGAVVVVQAGTQTQPPDQLLDLPVVEAFVLAGRAEAFARELPGDRGAAQALPGQGPDPLREGRVVRQLLDPGPAAPARPARLPSRARAGGPPAGSPARPAGTGAGPGHRRSPPVPAAA